MFNQGKVYVNGVVTWTSLEKQVLSNFYRQNINPFSSDVELNIKERLVLHRAQVLIIGLAKCPL